LDRDLNLPQNTILREQNSAVIRPIAGRPNRMPEYVGPVEEMRSSSVEANSPNTVGSDDRRNLDSALEQLGPDSVFQMFTPQPAKAQKENPPPVSTKKGGSKKQPSESLYNTMDRAQDRVNNIMANKDSYPTPDDYKADLRLARINLNTATSRYNERYRSEQSDEQDYSSFTPNNSDPRRNETPEDPMYRKDKYA